jgi:2'-deoxynucleoside 5'-phosphate N-hydrolase
MKIYFGCSIRGEQGGAEDKKLVVSILQDLGHEVLSEVFANMDVNYNQVSQGKMTPRQVYESDMKWLIESDVMVAEVSRISTGLGYEMGWKLKSGQRVIALCREDRYEQLSNMIKGCTVETFSLHVWKDELDLREILEKEIDIKNA